MDQITICLGRAVAVAAALTFGVSACSREPAEPRAIRAHASVKMGVAHAEPTGRAERYCASCHGDGLRGGAAAEPSCYQCHGKTWPDEASPTSPAPADHTVINEDYHHAVGLMTPLTECAACHGPELRGDLSGGLTVPGCELCHVRLWESR